MRLYGEVPNRLLRSFDRNSARHYFSGRGVARRSIFFTDSADGVYGTAHFEEGSERIDDCIVFSLGPSHSSDQTC